MRELKFRAYDKDRGNMEYIDDLYWFEEEGVRDSSGNGHYILMQYTGLKDSEGQEIYEGDIVYYKQRNLEAAFGMSEGEDYIEKTRKIKYSDQSFNVPAGFIKDLKVTGNIYENQDQTMKENTEFKR